MTLHHGDCLDMMAGMEPESVDAIVTDPPYGLEFMGKAWDKLDTTRARIKRADEMSDPAKRPSLAHSVSYQGGASAYGFHLGWAEAAYRIAKPSAYLLAFGGTRTVHRMTCALEDAGWIIRDMLVWGYASGFPKSKASLKPAWEPIVMARKPGPLRMLAVDACRIPMTDSDATALASSMSGQRNWRRVDAGTVTGLPTEPDGGYIVPHGRQGEASADRRYDGAFAATPGPRGGDPSGRWPANIVLTDPIFDGGIEGVVGGGETSSGLVRAGWIIADDEGERRTYGDFGGMERTEPTYGDTGTYSRFFLVPKAARSDREPLLAGTGRIVSVWGGDEDDLTPGKKSTIARQNGHPTVKPVDLMRHLVRLVTPTSGIVLDPFLGSGTTALAAEMEGFPWVGIEREAEYVAIAEARLNGVQRGLGLEAS